MHGVAPWLQVVASARRLLPDRWMLALYSRPSLAGFLRGVLNVFAPPGEHLVEVAGGRVRGLRLWVDLRREKYLWLGTYEPRVQEAIAHHIRPGDWAWDIGAFIGYHALLMWRLGANVVALEPDPLNFARLTRNLAANGAHAVKALALAAGRYMGRAQLQRHPGHPSQTRLTEDGRGECGVVTLDSLLVDLPSPRLVKIDVEGAELEVLAGAARILREARPVWIVEVHGSADLVAGHFQRYGYQVRRVGKGAGFDLTRKSLCGSPGSRDLHLSVGGPGHLLVLPLGAEVGSPVSTL